MPVETHVDYKIAMLVKSGDKATCTIRIYHGFYGDIQQFGPMTGKVVTVKNVYQRTAMIREVVRVITGKEAETLDFNGLKRDLGGVLSTYKGVLTTIPEQEVN